MYKFVIRQNKHRQFVVRFTYRGETMFTSPPRSTKDGALDLIASIKLALEEGNVPTEDKT